MALTPPNNNQGDYNTTATGPDVWDEVQSTNHQVIDRNDMPFASTVEYTGYYKAEATGPHNFNLSGSQGVTGYAWLSSAPRGSDHIKLPQEDKIKTVSNKSYGIIIPNRRSTTGYWIFEDTDIVGTFPGYGYWPKDDYGNPAAWGRLGYNGEDEQEPDCTTTWTQVEHPYLVPGDIRSYENAPVTQFGGRRAGPGWQAPEDPNFASPCWPDSQDSPLKRICRSTDDRPCDSDATPNTPGKSSQVFLDTSFKAEGLSATSWANYEIVQDNRTSELDGGEVYIWPQQVSVTRTGNGKSQPERVRIAVGLYFKLATQQYTFEFKSRDGLKMWYRIGGGDNRDFLKFPDGVSGNNPCNLTASAQGNGNIWKPGGGEDGFSGQINIPENTYVTLTGYAVGVPSLNEHGWSLVIRDEAGNPIWDTSSLLTGSQDDLIGIDECGYNALIGQDDRDTSLKVSEFYRANGWGGYLSGDIFTADASANDNQARSPSTTRQYLWSNALTKTRGGQSIPGTVYLRQGDYYFIRAIVSNNLNQSANFRFTVVSPASGASQSVRFTGNGDPSLDTGVGGNAGGNGIPISPSDLCDSVLAPGGQAIANDDTNFALLDDLDAVLNLNVLGVSDTEIGREGQAESLSDGGQTGESGSVLITFTDPNDTNNTTDITLSQLVRGGKPGPDGLPPLDADQRSIVFAVYQQQAFPDSGSPQVLSYNTFKSAITSQAVKQWGLTGNYPYIYHAVSDVITSICTGVDIEVPVVTNVDGPGNQTLSSDTCIDLDLTQLSDSEAQITTECFNNCKTPNQYPMLESQYNKKPSDFNGTAPGYDGMVRTPKDYGMVAPTAYSLPSASSNGDYNISTAYAQYDNAFFNPGQVTSAPLTVPDVFVPDEFDIESSGGKLECSFKFELSSNTFLYDPDEVGDSIEGGVDRPYLCIWVSATPGGPALGGVKRFKLTTPPFSSTIASTYRATCSYDQFVADQQKSAPTFDGYLGNTYGVRWINYAPLVRADVQAANFVIPEPGSQAFVDMLSVKGYRTNEIRIFATLTSPDCTSLLQSRSLITSGTDPSFKSAPDMIPFI